jgi:hypothetical protein
MSADANDILMGGGGPQVAKFPQGKQPVTAKGVVSSTSVRQAQDMDKKPKFFESGDPMMDVIIVLDNCEITPTLDENAYRGDDADDGRRRLICGFEMQKAIGQAIRAAGARGIENGAELAVQYYGDGEAKKAGANRPKLFRAQYRPPAAGSGVNDLLGGAAPDGNGTPAPAAQQQTPAPQPEPAGSLL